MMHATLKAGDCALQQRHLQAKRPCLGRPAVLAPLRRHTCIHAALSPHPIGWKTAAPFQPHIAQQGHQRAGSIRSFGRAPARPLATPPRAAASEGMDPVKALKKELGVQSNRLDPQIKERVERAIDSLGYRVTVGDVAARAGVKLSEAEEALKALAYDSLGHLEVSQEGEVIYAFSPSYRTTIRSRSLVQRIRPALTKVKRAAGYLSRLAFGGTLIVSVVLVLIAITVLMTSARSDRDDRRGGFGGGMRVWMDPTDLIYIWSPRRYRRRVHDRMEHGEGMSFLEAVFSFVFGDGDPNEDFEERRWRAVGQHIQRLGGVVTAEELAPFLDPPPLKRPRGGPNKYEDESFVLPALIRFGGEPFVGEDGALLYKFPSLQAGAAELRREPATARVPVEAEWGFSEADPGQQVGAFMLGLVNVVGILVLSNMLADPYAKMALLRNGLGFVTGLMPILQAYAAAFVAVPLLRMFDNGRKNAAISARNDARSDAVALLQSGDADLASKEAAARKLGGRRVIGRQDVVYTTETEVDAQVNANEEEEFDRRVGVKAQANGLRGRGRVLQDSSSGQRRYDDVFDRRRQRQAAEEEGAQRVFERRRGGGRSDWGSMDRW